jgi:hypothetical protein
MLTRMAFKANKVSLALLLLSLLVLLCASLALAKQDPELKQCKHQCKHQRQFDEQQTERCERSCEEYYREKREREKEREVNSIREEESYDEREEREDEEQEEEDNNPYVFDDEDFETRVETEEGSVRSLERFTQRSKLLRGLKNYRVAILEANPHAFISPHHYDAHLVLFVADGNFLFLLNSYFVLFNSSLDLYLNLSQDTIFIIHKILVLFLFAILIMHYISFTKYIVLFTILCILKL